MVLTLNETKETYKEFYGRNFEQMPQLIVEGRVPMNVSQLMQRRIDVRNDSNDLKSSWMDNYFDTGDAVVYHPDGRVKIVLDSQYLRNMTPKSGRNGGALVLIEDVYKSLQGEEFKKGKFVKVNDPSLSIEDVKAHPVWKVLARDQGLLNDYADYIFAEGKERFGYNTAMGVYLDSIGNNLKLRAWFVGRFGSRSNAGGRDGLDDDDGRFVGIAPEVQSTLSKINNLERSVIS